MCSSVGTLFRGHALLHMQAETITAPHTLKLAVLNLVVGVVLSALGCIITLEIFSWWGIAVLIACILAAVMLSLVRKRRWLAAGYVPWTLATVGILIVIVFGTAESEWLPTSGMLLTTIAAFDLIKRGWETPWKARAVWSSIQWLALFFGISGIVITLSDNRPDSAQSSTHVARTSRREPSSSSSSPKSAVPSPGYEYSRVPTSARNRIDEPRLASPRPEPDSSSAPSFAFPASAEESAEIDSVVGIDPSERVLGRWITSHLYDAAESCIDWHRVYGREAHSESLLSITLMRGEQVTSIRGPDPSQARYRCRISQLSTGSYGAALAEHPAGEVSNNISDENGTVGEP